MVADSVLTPDGTSLHLTYTPAATCILIAGYLGLSVIQRLDEILASLPKDGGPPVLVRILHRPMPHQIRYAFASTSWMPGHPG